MEYIVNEELFDWISNNETPANKPESFNNFTFDDIGDWEGEEELATRQLNWIMSTLELMLEGMVDQTTISALKGQVWSDWSKDTRILDIDEQGVIDYVQKLVSENPTLFFNRKVS